MTSLVSDDNSGPVVTTSTPLYVDLDGALCATDTLWESLLELVRRQPLLLPQVPFWILKGKSRFKDEVARRVLPDVATLPIRPEVMELLANRKAAGDAIILATAADSRIARAVAERVGLFSDVLASDGETNLAAANKLDAVRAHARGGPFDYVGDSKADLVIFRHCRKGYVAGPNEKVWQTASGERGDGSLVRLQPKNHGAKSLIRALRPHQWAKNVLLGVPLLTSHRIGDTTALVNFALAFIAFSLIASSIYIINDLLDLPSDRAHPTKHRRPFASGALSIPTGILLAAALLVGGLGLGTLGVSVPFGGMLIFYVAVTTLYSTVLKRMLLLDVYMLAGLFTLRILAGAVAEEVRPSEWLLAFSMFIFTSLAMVKRCSELKTWSKMDKAWAAGRGYTVSDIQLLRSAGIASAFAAVLVFALYINSPAVTLLYSRPQVLWVVCPILMYWLTRIWFLTNRDNKVLDDPVLFALTDRASIACGILVGLLVAIAT